jgi:peptidoglycan/LPS O-acetylase OafA/YrhL
VWASGGFVGVDLFFVISGYLITGQIRQDLADSAFTVKNFYLRRIRRIVPHLLAMLIAASFAAWLVLKPEDIRSFVYSLIVQPFSLQNLVFLSEGDYFRGAETKALLHTWSLAVEEQFYLFWPLLLLLLKRLPFKPLVAAICVVIAASFYLSATLTLSEPKAAFFLIFTRAWELGFGGLAALLNENHKLEIRNPLTPWLTKCWAGSVSQQWGMPFFALILACHFQEKLP